MTAFERFRVNNPATTRLLYRYIELHKADQVILGLKLKSGLHFDHATE